MKTLRTLFALLLLVVLPVQSAEYITAVLTITNQPSTYGLKYTVNGNVRTATNAQTSSGFLTNTTFAGTATNIFNQLALGGVGSGTIATLSYSNVTFQGVALTASVDAGLGKMVLSTQSIANAYSVIVPFDVLSTTNRTNTADAFVYGIGRYSLTETIPAASRALTNFVNQGLSQSVSNKSLTHSVGTNLLLSGGILTNASGINGNLHGLTNGWIVGTKMTNGSVHATNGTLFNVFASSFTVTNLSSPGSGENSLQFGVGADSGGTNSVSIGNNSYATGWNGVALGANAAGIGYSSSALGTSAEASGDSGTAVGYNAGAIEANTTAVGVDSSASHQNSTAIGYSAATTASNQVMLGTSTTTVAIPGRLILDAGLTNSVLKGTNFLYALGLVRTNNSGLANGDNAGINIGAHSYVKLSGPTAAFGIVGIAGGYDGRVVTLQKVDGYTCTVKNDSGVEPTAANRIYTGTGADVTFTNNPGVVSLIYDGATSRWVIMTKSN